MICIGKDTNEFFFLLFRLNLSSYILVRFVTSSYILTFFLLLFVCCWNGRSVKYDYTSDTRVYWWTIHSQYVICMYICPSSGLLPLIEHTVPIKEKRRKSRRGDLVMSDDDFSSCHFNSIKLLNVRRVKWQSI